MQAFTDFKPGDLIGFSSRDFLGAMINLGTWGIPFVDLSHVAVVGYYPFVPMLLLWESTSLYHAPCFIQGHDVDGVQAHEVLPRISDFRGRVYHYPLRHPIDPWKLTRALKKRLGEGYDLVGAWRARQTPLAFIERRLRKHNAHALRCSQFCSDLVADVWKDCGVWSPDHSDDWSPNRLARTAREVGIIGDRKRIK